MDDGQPNPEPFLRVGDLATGKETPFEVVPDAAARAALADALGLLGLRKLRFAGQLTPVGKDDWRLTARLGATVVQPCVVTLEPVVTRIEEDVERLFVAEVPDLPEGAEIEMPEDDQVDALGDGVALGTVMAEVLALALPLYPRAERAALEQAQFAGPGVTPMTDEDARPFAGLKELRDKLDKNG
ncbi:MAG: DUF177 domain-containing protein [Pseudomonadota bacterium]